MAKSYRQTKVKGEAGSLAVGRNPAGKTAVLVLGAPRSGTSAVSNLLSELGVDFGQPERFVDPTVHTHNPAFFELQSLNALNEQIVTWFGYAYASFEFLPLRNDFDAEQVQRFLPLCKRFLESEFGNASIIGLKDPRFCFVLPLWVNALQELGYRVRCVHVLRPLAAVVESNARVNVGWPFEQNVRVAALSTLAATYFVDGLDCLHVDYDKALNDPEKAARRFAGWLEFELEDAKVAAAATVLKRELRQHKGSAVKLPEPVASISADALAGALPPACYRDFAQLMHSIGFDSVVASSFESETGVGRKTGAALSDDTARLYFRGRDENYGEARALSQRHKGLCNLTQINFELPARVRADCVRFDPSSAPGAFNVSGIRINGEPVADLGARVRGVNRCLIDQFGDQSVGFVSFDGDPQIEFDLQDVLSACTGPVSIELDCCKLDTTTAVGSLIVSQVGSLKTAQAREAGLQCNLEEAQTRLARLESELSEKRERETGTLREAFWLSAKVVKVQEQLDAANGHSADLEARCAELEARHAESESRIAQLESELAEKGDREATALREAFWLSGKNVRASEQLDAVRGSLAELEARYGALAGRLHGQQTLNAGLQTELAEIRRSTLWRVLVRVRGLLLKIPRGARSLLRRGMKITWWVLTPWRIPARIRFLRSRRRAGQDPDA